MRGRALLLSGRGIRWTGTAVPNCQADGKIWKESYFYEMDATRTVSAYSGPGVWSPDAKSRESRRDKNGANYMTTGKEAEQETRETVSE